MRRYQMITQLPFEAYDLITPEELIGMITAPEIVEVVLADSDNQRKMASARLVGWTRNHQQVYLRDDGYLAYAGDPWIPMEGSVPR
jgi:pyruvoyl-dependent arginine decarboxylase (PvlArgDC)